MVSDAYRRVEDLSAQAQIIHDDLIKELEYKLNEDKPVIEQAIYRTCITTTARPIDIAHILNEFFMHLRHGSN